MQKFYCCGSIKSGTTFLQRLLDLHPKISCKPEQDFGYLFRKLFDLKKNYNLKIKDIHNIMGLDEHLMTDDVFIAGYFKIIDEYLNEVDHSIEFSGVNDNGFLLRNAKTFLNGIPGSKIIFIVRNPIDTALSYWDHAQRLYIKRNNPVYLEPLQTNNKLDIEKFTIRQCNEWNENIISILNLKKSDNKNVLVIKYEDLVKRKEEKIIDLLHFFGLPIEDKTLQKMINESSLERMRDNSKNPSFYSKSRINSGQDFIGENIINQIIKSSAESLKEMQYEI